jgi:hypothetical protein
MRRWIEIATLKLLTQPKLVVAFAEHCRASISQAYIPGMVAPKLESGQRSPAGKKRRIVSTTAE